MRIVRKRKKTVDKGYDYASTQFNMPVKVMAKALAFAAEIDEDDLTGDGVETDSHVTVKYGLRDDAVLAIGEIVASYAPIRLEFGAVSLFERDEFDVVKVDVESADLRLLHHELAARLPNHESWPVYNPHLTIAYVKPGMGQKYMGDGPLLGESVVVDTLQYSTSSGQKLNYSLRGDVNAGAVPAEKDARAHFTTYKDKNGRYRWLMISSNSYQDRDGEWVTQKAQEADVDRMNARGQFGTLDWWHTKLQTKDGRVVALDIGDCDHAVMLGRFRLESGTYRDESIGAALAATDKELRASLEFAHPKSEPVNGEYSQIMTIRRSVLPADRPANLLTGFSTSQKELRMSTYERLKAMAGTAGVDATLKAIADAMELDETAKGLGIKAKSFDLATADLSDLEAQIAAEKERRAQAATQQLETAVEFDGEALAAAIGKSVKEAVTEAVNGLGDRLEAVVTQRTKEQVETDRKAAELEAKMKELQTQYEDLVNPSKAVNRAKEQPNGGYRPSQQNPVTAQKGQDAGSDGLATLATDIMGGGA